MNFNTRPVLLAVGLGCFALIGAALYLQHVENMLPCALCVIQRYAFFGAGVFCLVAAAVARPKPWVALALASALGGLYTAGRHLYVLANPGFSCGIDPTQTLLNKIPTAQYLPWLFKSDGLCEDGREVVLGLMIPQWSALGLAMVAALLLWVLLRRRPA
ncbi:disulfide bond formation protein B [Massilia glaciei]|uniref:Disulfide bond formation protein B n=1 Tax=Massilia glaciei TaxID=1524097 RepID=A0A2U2I5S3_9BURK|nr:disulfide bond formation protein B [Massilia glaciei]PWF55110.1 disulfide bond formation protein B [Massilia glaciei]